MKSILVLLLCSLFLLPAEVSADALNTKTTAEASPIHDEARAQWHSNKYSMFIHFGLYSVYGGVYQGEPVKFGYSEQIQSFAGIFSDWYGRTALEFNPTLFNADEIVALAKEAGMRSIVITTKHHDGFCMFRTATTDYNSVDATPCKRDFVKELSDACQRGGIKFGLYFSLIDWHYPYAYPISSHNCDFITPPHHELNKNQVTELLTNYGNISELWFDMGSNNPQQSKELYQLVHKLQPDCMVSGRVGNGWYDFAVMADNSYPEGALQTDWQSAASMFNETWSYRSWQERGSSHVKAMEKLRSLINVVAHGGNFLLNIGPKGDGSVVPFESDVLKEIGAWLKKHGDAIYGTESSPYRQHFDWGNMTRKDNKYNLILSGDYPEGGVIELPIAGYQLTNMEASFGKVEGDLKKGVFTCKVPASAFDNQTIHVITLTFDRPAEEQVSTAAQVTPNYSYDCFDYYSNYRSTVSYDWKCANRKQWKVTLTYTPEELGKEIAISKIENKKESEPQIFKLEGGKAITLKVDPRTEWGQRYLCGPGTSLFDAASTLTVDLDSLPERVRTPWQPVDDNHTFASYITRNYYMMQTVESPKAQDVIMELGGGNAVELYVNGVSVMKHLNPYRCTGRIEKVRVSLKKGQNQLVLRLYNRFEKQQTGVLRPAADQTLYQQTVICKNPDEIQKSNVLLRVRRTGLATSHTDTELHNLTLKIK